MKAKLFIVAVLFLTHVLPVVKAQTEVRVSVCVGEQRLTDLLTEEQKNTVTHLMITGTMAEEDYAFIRTNRLKRIVELNLRDADIETLPEHAFDFEWEYEKGYHRKEVILPSSLKHVSDYGLCVKKSHCDFVLTGKFPTLGKNVYCSEGNGRDYRTCLVPASDNDFVVENEGFLSSPDGSTLFFAKGEYFPDIFKGTNIIYGNAFEGCDIFIIELPEEIDSIGDRAFANIEWLVLTCLDCKDPGGYMICNALTPPKLGKEVFDDNQYNRIYVPDESVKLYEAAEGWKQCDISSLRTLGGINQLRSENGRMSVEKVGGSLLFKSPKEIDNIKCYSLNGRMMHDVDVHAREAVLNDRLLKTMSLVFVRFEDGTSEAIKLKP
ncbi:MAG: leucine-rich repeat domain-containing protein [Prevotella sp.]|nr:leucine-rich repeat domain-containing protein [Prevotella sp.]